jgi:hypothetical protein
MLNIECVGCRLLHRFSQTHTQIGNTRSLEGFAGNLRGFLGLFEKARRGRGTSKTAAQPAGVVVTTTTTQVPARLTQPHGRPTQAPLIDRHVRIGGISAVYRPDARGAFAMISAYTATESFTKFGRCKIFQKR